MQKLSLQRLSSLGMHLTMADVLAIGRLPAISMIVRTPVSHDFRKMVRIEISDTFYWADKSTGTLYHPTTGECLSSTSMHLLSDLAGQTYEAMKKHFPKLQKRHIEPKSKPGPKPGGVKVGLE